ncbi:FAD-dependent oxidoreductase [Paenibacillus silviterrae]|uniref:FAD-dependent oxidoreductase n=1 Tax=Paenibacillus silviterrae TaxID=3242194 RepID=UPI002542DB4E|nr:FAD-dependent oxidoreductase [Paenibacillus chinjuensis]
MNYFTESTSIPIKDEYDVIIIGGGIAGVSAALAARRSGMRVLIVEKGIALGGLVTSGLIVFYLCALCDGYGRKIMSGIAEELLHLSIKYGYDNLPEAWRNRPEHAASKRRYATVFNAYAFILALDELMEQEGIDVLYDTVFSSAVVENGWCKGVIVENKEGRLGYRAAMFVDASGDADLMKRAGAACVEDGNWLTYWAYSTNLAKQEAAAENNEVYRGLKLEAHGSTRTGHKHPEGMKRFTIHDGMEISEFVKAGRRLLLSRVKQFDRNSETLTTLPSLPQLRTTRRITGYYVLSNADKNKVFEDAVGCSTEEDKPYHVFEIPYRTLIAPGVHNIVASGRIISSVDHARESTRLISTCAVTGQAAGTAVKLALELGCAVQDIPVAELQRRLMAAGAIVHYQPVLDKYPGATSLNPDDAQRSPEAGDSLGSPGH